MERPPIELAQPRLTLRVLLAEDEHAPRAALAALLRGAGCEVVEATSGTELLERVADDLVATDSVEYDVIVSDSDIPGWSGLGAVSGLRGSGLAVPVVLMATLGAPVAREQARALGAIVLERPFADDAFLALVLQAAMSERPTLVSPVRSPLVPERAPISGPRPSVRRA